MSSSLRLHNRIDKTLDEFLPDLHAYRRRNLAWLVTGIHLARHVHLSKVADHRAGAASLPSKVRQFRRFLDNEAVEAQTWYRPVARRLLERAARKHKRLRLLFDIVELPGHRQVLMLALAYRRRALPLVWQVRRARGKTDAQTQIAFLKQFEALLVGLYPAQTRPVIIADGEFHAVELMRYLDGMGWGFRLRLHGDTLVHLPDGPGEGSICSLAEIGLRPGARQYLQGVYLTALHAYGPISIATYWAAGEDAPWFIVTDEETASYRTLEDYSRRMWIEELFGDLQGGGLHLHRSRLHQPARISRLLLAVCLVFLWLMHVGVYVIKQGARALVDRRDRRDRSLAEIGRHWIRRQLTHDEMPKISFIPYF